MTNFSSENLPPTGAVSNLLRIVGLTRPPG